ncbi:hypothetical protein L6164_028937 [Bauhinia variegata]|uniref:Uncharacterized protein n=1 Tax=Bauhinia variegata TaxID=167791 RepID=A0ACB9L868_BAUVA|nr:hypothetical protein L6164_028937 [Bauhinia variegata]
MFLANAKPSLSLSVSPCLLNGKLQTAMRSKSVRRLSSVNRPLKTANATAAVRRCPPIVGHSEDVNDAAVPETYSDSDDDPEDGRMAGSTDNMTDCMKEHSNGSPVGISSHDYLCIDILDRKICLACNEGGDVLICSEIGCPVSLHSKCIRSKPSFDNMGNFYCPYCKYKRAVAKVQELKNKVLIEKKDLSKFLGKNVGSGDKAVQKNETVKRTEHHEVPHTGVEDFLDGCNGKSSNDVQSQPLRTKGDQERERTEIEYPRHNDEGLHEICLENREEEEALNASPLRMLRLKDIEHDDKDLHETSRVTIEEEEPLNASPLGVLRMKGIKEILQKEPRVPPTDRSISETISSYSYLGDFSLKKGCLRNGANRTAYPQMVDSNRESPHKSKISGTNARFQNLEATQSRRLPQGFANTRATHAKRRRVLWTTEEENMLKEGVSRFSTENQNVPWRKILEYGSNVFDSTRTPVDLKDKWRNMVAKGGRS